MKTALKIIGGILGLGALSVAWKSICYVPSGHRMIIFDKLKGLTRQTYLQGFHFITPFVQIPFLFDIKGSMLKSQIQCITVDKQTVKLSINTLNRPDKQNLHSLFRMFGMNYEKLVLQNILKQSVKQTVQSRYSGNDLLLDRNGFVQDIKKSLKQKNIQNYFIQVLDISVVGIQFSKQFEQKMQIKSNQ